MAHSARVQVRSKVSSPEATCEAHEKLAGVNWVAQRRVPPQYPHAQVLPRAGSQAPRWAALPECAAVVATTALVVVVATTALAVLVATAALAVLVATAALAAVVVMDLVAAAARAPMWLHSHL